MLMGKSFLEHADKCNVVERATLSLLTLQWANTHAVAH
jgi:hypothetical protein